MKHAHLFMVRNEHFPLCVSLHPFYIHFTAHLLFLLLFFSVHILCLLFVYAELCLGAFLCRSINCLNLDLFHLSKLSFTCMVRVCFLHVLRDREKAAGKQNDHFTIVSIYWHRSSQQNCVNIQSESVMVLLQRTNVGGHSIDRFMKIFISFLFVYSLQQRNCSNFYSIFLCTHCYHATLLDFQDRNESENH